MLQSDENEPEHPSDSEEGSTKGEPQVNIISPTMHLQTQMYQFLLFKQSVTNCVRTLRFFLCPALCLSPCIVKEHIDFPSCLAGQTIHSHYCVSADC